MNNNLTEYQKNVLDDFAKTNSIKGNGEIKTLPNMTKIENDARIEFRKKLDAGTIVIDNINGSLNFKESIHRIRKKISNDLTYDFNEAKDILNKESLTIDDMSYFTDEKIAELDKMRIAENKEALELYDILTALNSTFKMDHISFCIEDDTFLDGVNSKQLKDLLHRVFPVGEPNGKADVSKKEEALQELRKLLKRDKESRDIFNNLIDSLKD